MNKDREIIIQNRLVADKRDINVYHRESGSAHMISYNSSVKLMLRPTEDEDFLHISLVSGPGDLKHTIFFYIPLWVDFEFLNISGITLNRFGERNLLKIPPGLSNWQLRLTHTNYSNDSQIDEITIGDERYNFPTF